MRNNFINTLTEQAALHTNIFLLCGDLGYSVLEPFAESFPDRFLNVGIAEQNMTQVATGLAREGYNVFTYSIGNFPTLRCIEQIRYDVCYHNANVKVIAVGGGYAYGPLGASHHTTEDLSMLRSIPNMIVTAPADAVEASAMARLFASHTGPGYVRINKSGEPRVHSGEMSLSVGQMIHVKDGSDVVVLTTGAVLEPILAEIETEKLPWAVVSVPFVSHLDTKFLIDLASKYKRFVTVEEHQLNGGFGSAVLEQLSDLTTEGAIGSMPILHRVGIKNAFISHAGSQSFLRQEAGINLQSVRHLAK